MLLTLVSLHIKLTRVLVEGGLKIRPDMNLAEAELQVSITLLFVLFLKTEHLENSDEKNCFPGQGKATLLFDVLFTVGERCQNG